MPPLTNDGTNHGTSNGSDHGHGSDELRVPWMPAFPAACVTLILLAVLLPVGALLTVAGLATVVVRLVQRRWDVWAWVGLGAVIGAVVFSVLVLLHALF